ncbi:MAG: CAP domain-containing protein [Acidimicrobiales bacterium]
MFAVLSVHFVALVTGVAAPAHAEATFESRAVELINQARAAVGAPPVQVLPALAAVAGDAPYDGCGYRVDGRSADMGARNYFSHTILNCGNRRVGDMLNAGGAGYTGVAENIAWASALTDPMVAAERLHNDLMASPPHRSNILNPASTHVGVGSWRSAAGVSWTGGGAPVRNVFLTTQIFTSSAGGPVPAAAARYHPLTPRRILDTRTASPLGPGASMFVQVAGAGGVPAAGVSAVILNVTVTGPTAASFLCVFPAGEALPGTSSLNYRAGLTVLPTW